ncbi:MAG: hypothetical protein ACOVMP_03240 [Chthoniobacterales bacterium]
MNIFDIFSARKWRLAGVVFATAALPAVAQYETDTIPPGVVPRSSVPVESSNVDASLLAPDAASTIAPDTQPSVQQSPTPAVTPPPPALILNAQPTTADEKARFLTGRRLTPGSRLASLQSTPWYLDHAKAFSSAWRGFDEKYFARMRQWSAAQLTPRVGTPSTVFYLFGGPDFINAYALFPDATTYILGGLEPVGAMIPPEQLDEARLSTGLTGLRESTSVILQFSHFITKDMKVDFEKTDFKGVLPILLSFLSLGGAEVIGVQFFGIDKTGSLTISQSSTAPAGMLPGVKVDFRKSPVSPIQSVYYIQADASDGALKSNPALLTWMRQFAPGVTYLKAASYLLHENYFSTVRTFLLQESRAVLQDDSGIPIRFFPPGTWNVTFFGAYSGTLDLFAKYFQKDLEEIYRSGMPVLPIDFGTGYKWQLGESNLMLAVKAGITTPSPAAPVSVEPVR